MKPAFRIGLGYDSHRFEAGRPLVLGGIIIPHEYGLAGHSDADVLLHAVADSLLGAAGLGDIGTHFPDTDEKYRGMKSTRLLADVFTMIVKEGYQVGNVDTVIVAERPRLAPHIVAMQSKIAKILIVPGDAVSIKATTNEKMGFVGREEGIAVMAISLLYKDDGTIIQPDK
jgi:2-C-methyl-D-erythritol 2,4-cyclodiphosphate synthase